MNILFKTEEIKKIENKQTYEYCCYYPMALRCPTACLAEYLWEWHSEITYPGPVNTNTRPIKGLISKFCIVRFALFMN